MIEIWIPNAGISFLEFPQRLLGKCLLHMVYEEHQRRNIWCFEGTVCLGVGIGSKIPSLCKNAPIDAISLEKKQQKFKRNLLFGAGNV